MGYMQHHTIVVSSWGGELIEKAHRQAVSALGDLVSPVMGPFMNNYSSFFVAPDGSKEGWQMSIDNDQRRVAFVTWLEHQRYEDLSTSLHWVEVQFADDGLETCVVSDSDEAQRERCRNEAVEV